MRLPDAEGHGADHCESPAVEHPLKNATERRARGNARDLADIDYAHSVR